MKGEVDFLPADKLKGFFKLILDMLKLPKITSFRFLCNIVTKK